MPSRTLADEMRTRTSNQCRFEEKDLWGILAACVCALNYLKTAGLTHGQLTTDAILLTPEGHVKLYTPDVLGVSPSYEQVYSCRTLDNTYLSPELTVALSRGELSPDYNLEKSDVWTMGMIMIETAFTLNQKKAYNDLKTRVHFEYIHAQLQKFKDRYSLPLFKTISSMLLKES